jgi:hypothetical protein
LGIKFTCINFQGNVGMKNLIYFFKLSILKKLLINKILTCLFITLLLLFSTICISCQNPVNTDGKISRANAGEDQTTYVGSFAVLDPTKSYLAGETVSVVEWTQDASNPAQIKAYATSEKEKTYAGFIIEGVYKLTLKITCKSGNIYTDDLLITVKPRQSSLIEDVNLEIRVRQVLDYKEGNLTSDHLLQLDSLSNYTLVLINKVKSLKLSQSKISCIRTSEYYRLNPNIQFNTIRIS